MRVTVVAVGIVVVCVGHRGMHMRVAMTDARLNGL